MVFPRSDTCFFNLELPNYSSKEVLKQKLLTAIYTDADSLDADTTESDLNEGDRLGGLRGGRAPRRRDVDLSSMLSFGGFGAPSLHDE